MVKLSEVETVKKVISSIETELIQQKKFQDDLTGQPKFVTNLDIQNKTGLDESVVLIGIEGLNREEFMVFDNILQINPDPKIKFFIRSRTYHTIWTLYKSTNRTRSNIESDVADYQYVRHIKRSPKYSNNLHDIFSNSDVAKIIDHKSKPLLDKVIDNIIKSTTIPYTAISNFQLNSTIKILKNLEANDPGSIVIEAGTGFGKSWAYQFPLLLWILNKKIKKLNDLRQNKIRPDELHVNCSALLIFPRITLADDQLSSISKAIDVINEVIAKDSDSTARSFLPIKKPLSDYGGKLRGKKEDRYGDNDKNGYPDIIITNAGQSGRNTIERRISDPDCSPVFKNGIDCILYDEVHLYEGIEGAEIASINARLQNLLQEKSKKFPLFVGMSATIDKAQLHCQKLFSLMTRNKPIKITQEEDDDTVPYSIEHHLILKPRSGRTPIGVAINTTSCLIHNRRINGLTASHDDQFNPSTVNIEEKHKSLTFIDSLGQTSKFAHDLNNYEWYYAGDPQRGRNASSHRPYRTYLFHYQPERRPQPGTPSQGFQPLDCEHCTSGLSPEIFSCPSYASGACWYYSEDSGGQFLDPPYSNWTPKVHGDRLTIPPDNIRSNRVSSLSLKVKDKYDYFIFNESVWIPDGQQPQNVPLYSDIDNVVATSTLEVGVDFKNIKEIIQYGDIKSPSSYKQKAGRGAREGNIVEGLFVMSVINDSPLAYHHFKHFGRLVKSSLDPLKLEPTNPDVLASNCFFSIFDFFALNEINLFKISKLSTGDVDIEYAKAKKLLSGSALEKYLERFFSKFNFPNGNVKKIIDYAKNFLEILASKTEIEIGNVKVKKSLHELLIAAVKDPAALSEARIKLGSNVLEMQGQATNDIRKNIEELKKAYKNEFSGDNSLDEKLEKLEDVLFG